MRPNLVFILADDLGYADLGCTGARGEPPVSPHLDGMAREGILFRNGYSNSSVCSPTRFALATGRWQYRLRGAAEEPLTGRAKGDKVIGLSPDHPTLASLLRDAGYATGLIGKWHLGYPPHFGPLKSGYQKFFGPLSGGVDYFTHKDSRGQSDLYRDDTPVECQGYLTDLISDEAARFIEHCDARQPFMLSVHYTAPHWPWETRSDRQESDRIRQSIHHLDGGSLRTYQQMVREMDEGVGRILAALESAGRDADTLVVFTSDNGGERYSDTWPLVGGKMDLLEGGIRVPLIARWPARIRPGLVTDASAITMDWVATMLAAAKVQPHASYPLDGVDLSPLFENPAACPERDLLWRMKHRDQRAMRRGPWKYLRVDGHDYLFNLDGDQREQANLMHRFPERLKEMRKAWEAWSATMPAIPEEAGVWPVYSEDDLPRPTH